MPKKEHSTESTASSWWKERGKILESIKSESKTEKSKSKKVVKTKKAQKAEKGMSYICEICGCEIECVSDSAGTIICCEQPMMLIC